MIQRKALILLITGVIVVAAISLFWIFRKEDANAWERAEVKYKEGNYQEVAKEIGDKGLPKESEKLEIYARTMMAVKEYSKAYEAYDKLASQTKNLDAEIMMGNIRNEESKTNEAEKIYREVIQKNQGFLQAYLNLASLYRAQGQKDKANEVLNEGIKNNPNAKALFEYLLAINADKKGSPDYVSWQDRLRAIDPNNQLLK